jgi:multiple sugar transport system substrate-binding protein
MQAIRDKDLQSRLFAIPTATNLTGIWYRKDIFAEKGVDAPNTWDKFFEACEKLTDKTTGMYGHTLRGGAGSTNQLMYEVVSYVGVEKFFSEDGKAQIFRDPLAAEFVNRFADVYKKGQAPESSLTAGFKEMVADFNANLAATLIHNLGSYENQSKTFTPDQYAFVPFPTAMNGKLTTIIPTCKGIGISSTTKYPDQAWEYTNGTPLRTRSPRSTRLLASCRPVSTPPATSGLRLPPHMSNLPEFTLLRSSPPISRFICLITPEFRKP